MADDWQEYIKDSRTVCKYGVKCYQKNPDHHQHFKHPPMKRKDDKHTTNRKNRRYSPYAHNKKPVSPEPKGDKEDEDEVKIQAEPSTTSAPSISNDHDDTPTIIELPEDLSFYDKNTDKDIFKKLFLVDMPDDFFKFFEFISTLDKSAEESMAKVNLELIGPFDLLQGKLPILEDKELYLIHWRFFYDPPEFQAILKKKNSEYHIGYFRDTPEQQTAFLASNDSAKGYRITLMSENIFGAVYRYLQNEKKHSLFTTVPCQKLMDKIKAYAEENNISLEEFTMKKRSSQIVTRSFHGAGVAVPYNKKTQLGYRRLVETDSMTIYTFYNIKVVVSLY